MHMNYLTMQTQVIPMLISAATIGSVTQGNQTNVSNNYNGASNIIFNNGTKIN